MVAHLKSLRSFTCHCLEEKGIPSAIGEHLTGLTSLDLMHSSSISALYQAFPLPSSFTRLKQLQQLRISHINMASVPEGMFSPSSPLTMLRLTPLRLSLPQSFTTLRNLEDLGLRGVPASATFPACLSMFSLLRNLDIAHIYGLRSFPDSLTSLTLLAKLKLASLEITSLPASLGALAHLTYLKLYNCPNLRQLPDSLGQLASLGCLTLHDVGVTSLPHSIGDLSSLTDFYLAACKHLQDRALLPLSFFSLPRLKSLFLRDLPCLPVPFTRLTTLEKLVLYNLPSVTTLPESICQLALLTRLRVGNCPLESLPEGVGELTGLQSLIIDSPVIRDWPFALPASVSQLTALTSLEVGGCLLPPQVQWFTGLQRGVISSQLISSLPHFLMALTGLTSLSLLDLRCLSTMPRWITEFRLLADLKIIRCPQVSQEEGMMIDMLPGLKELTVSECNKLTWHVHRVGTVKRATGPIIKLGYVKRCPDEDDIIRPR